MGTTKQRAQGVLGKILGLITVIGFINCSTSKKLYGKIKPCEECFTIERLKMQNRNPTKSVLLFNYFDYDNKAILPFNFVIIDDFAFRENPVEIAPIDGTIEIIVSKHSRQPVKIENVKINMGDSLIVKVYLKEFNPVLE